VEDFGPEEMALSFRKTLRWHVAVHHGKSTVVNLSMSGYSWSMPEKPTADRARLRKQWKGHRFYLAAIWWAPRSEGRRFARA
jgi:hypothetical protein